MISCSLDLHEHQNKPPTCSIANTRSSTKMPFEPHRSSVAYLHTSPPNLTYPTSTAHNQSASNKTDSVIMANLKVPYYANFRLLYLISSHSEQLHKISFTLLYRFPVFFYMVKTTCSELPSSLPVWWMCRGLLSPLQTVHNLNGETLSPPDTW